MPMKRLSMRTIREILRLKTSGMSNRQIAKSCGISRPTVGKYLDRIAGSELTLPQLSNLSDFKLKKLLYPEAVVVTNSKRSVPDWGIIYTELSRKNVTLFLLWEEYRADHENGYQYSWFTEQYRKWAGKLDYVMRQHHKAGEKLFVDYAGHTIPIVNQHTGEITKTQIFVAVLVLQKKVNAIWGNDEDNLQ